MCSEKCWICPRKYDCHIVGKYSNDDYPKEELKR